MAQRYLNVFLILGYDFNCFLFSLSFADIDSTVASLQVRGMEGGEELEGEREEGVDYHQDFESSDSEGRPIYPGRIPILHGNSTMHECILPFLLCSRPI